jgi:hypothetical protein
MTTAAVSRLFQRAAGRVEGPFTRNQWLPQPPQLLRVQPPQLDPAVMEAPLPPRERELTTDISRLIFLPLQRGHVTAADADSTSSSNGRRQWLHIYS